MARDDRRKRRQARREARKSNQKTAEDFRREEQQAEKRAKSGQSGGINIMQPTPTGEEQTSYKSEKTGSQKVWGSKDELPEHTTTIKGGGKPGLTIVSPYGYTKEEAEKIRNEYNQQAQERSQAESQAIQALANNDATGTKTNVVNAVASSGKENTLSNLETAKKIGEGAAEQQDKNSAAQINNEDLGIALKGDDIKATPGASDFTKGGISTTQAPSYDPSAQQVQQDIAKQQKSQTPLAIDKLALQDYFPNAGRNIAVGTFTGSRIGSQTIYSGYGALAPMGLIDARKRAVAEKAKAKRAKLDQFLSIPNTYKVYHDFAKPYAAGKFAEIAAKHGWDYDKIMNDPDALKEVYRLKGVYETFEKAGTAAEELKELMQDPTKEVYISPKIRKKIWAFTRGQVNPEPYLSGKRDINEITKGMVPYPSFIKFFNDNSSNWFAEGRQGEMPISFKDYGPLTPEKLNEMKDGIDKFKINQDNDAYVELVKKHFAIDPNLVETWAKTNGLPLDDEIIEVWEDFFVNMIPPDVIEREITHVTNNAPDRALGWARLNQEKYQSLSLHNRIADEINRQGGVSNNSFTGNQTDMQRSQADDLMRFGLSNVLQDEKGVYASTPIDATNAPLLTNAKSNNSLLRVKDKSGQFVATTADQIIANKWMYDENAEKVAEKLIKGDLVVQPSEIVYRPGGYDNNNQLMIGNNANKAVKNKSIYSFQNGLAGELEIVDVDGVPVEKFKALPVEIITLNGDVTTEGGKYNSDYLVEEQRPTYNPKGPVKRQNKQ